MSGHVGKNKMQGNKNNFNLANRGDLSDAHPVSMRERSGKGKAGKNPHAVALGALGGKKGGPARAAKLSKKQLSEQGRAAVKARWAKHRAARKKKEQ